MQVGETAARGAKRERVEVAESSAQRFFRFADLSAYTFKQRLMIRVADLVFYVLIACLGRTIRFRVEGWEHWERLAAQGYKPIYATWHNRIFLATYFWRNRGIVVMTSQSFDGEYIARFIQRFGYGAARGSSTRGGVGALVEMVRIMRAGHPTGFTVDGPRGPRYMAKVGAVALARKTGQPLLPFTVNANRFLKVRSWDRLRIPYPFTTAHVRIGAPVFVAPEADDVALEEKRCELQTTLVALSDTEVQ